MRDRGKRLILAALVLSVLAAFVWVIRLQPPAPKTIRPAKAPSSAVPKSSESAPAAPADAAVGAPPPASARPPAPPAPSAPVAATPTAASRDQTLADFRSWTAEAIKAGSKSGDFLARGEALVRTGDPQKTIPSCAACHGAGLTGMQPGIPGLVGLRPTYITAQLTAWKVGERKAADPDCMKRIASRLTESDIAAVSAWLARQESPQDPSPESANLIRMPFACGSQK